jgi:hypothetical protein
LALPAFRTNREIKKINLEKVLDGTDLKIVPLDPRIKKYSKFISDRESIIYSRSDQLVLREIVILKKKEK